MQCSVNCPYRNQFDVCELTMRRVERMRTCAQRDFRRQVRPVSKMDTAPRCPKKER